MAVAAVAVMATGCAGDNSAVGLGATGADAIDAHVRFLSSDDLEGRAPGTRGSELAALYIATQFEQMGLTPGVGDSSYLQRFGLESVRSQARLSFRAKGGALYSPQPGDGFVGWSADTLESSRVDGELVFVGYGISAPDLGWDDYKDVEVNRPTSWKRRHEEGRRPPY
jgi:hypothetical protein